MLDNSQPTRQAEAVTPSDTVNLDETRALYIGGAGDLVLGFAGGGKVTLVGVLAGSLLPVGVKMVYAATTATNIVALR